MKKTILLAAMLLLAMGAKSQDTLVSFYPKSNCFYNYWLDSGSVISRTNLLQTEYHLVTAVYFDTKDTLQIYGIAGALRVWYNSLVDSTLDSSYEYWGIYKHEADTLRIIGDSLYVHPGYSPIAYYYHNANPTPALPPLVDSVPDDYLTVYERYYKNPITVTDSFYVGTTSLTWKMERIDSGPDSGMAYYPHPTVTMDAYMESSRNSPFKMLFKERYPWSDSIEYTYWSKDSPYGIRPYLYPYFFPILAPPDTTSNPVDTTHADTTHIDTTHIDTTHIDTTHVDTVGIAMRLLERYVGLQPNPAAERVQVLSSFGLQRIEVYNAAGVKVDERKATGYSATLDVSALPAGPYLVRIATPRGTVTKKLVVQRR